MPEIELLSVVELLKDLPEQNLVRGQVGTVVDLLSHDAVEVEFCDDDGVTLALLPLGADELELVSLDGHRH